MSCPPLGLLRVTLVLALLPAAPTLAGPTMVSEAEPNDIEVAGTVLPGNAGTALGNIFPAGDVDYYAFTAHAGDRVYAATMTAFSASYSVGDTVLELVGGGGTLEIDDDDGALDFPASSIAGAVIHFDGSYYLRVAAGSFWPTVLPYQLHYQIRSGSPVPEVEPNDSDASANPLPASGWVSGTHDQRDEDYFSLSLAAGDTVYLGLDLDPERDGVNWDGRLGFGLFGPGNEHLYVDNSSFFPPPYSEAMFMTVKSAGTYYVVVSSVSNVEAGTYQLSVDVQHATPATPNCTTYVSSDVPQTIPASGRASATVNVPGHPRIADLDVSLVVNNSSGDAAVRLRSPAGNDNGLYRYSHGNGLQHRLDLSFDDEAAIPIGSFYVSTGQVCEPARDYRLSWFDGEDGGGTWSLDAYGSNLGATLESFSLTLCEPPPPASCAGTLVTVYRSDFESDDGGFTHSGVADQWARGLPSGASAPILTCGSGIHCWKTNLTGGYSPNSSQDLLSPVVSLAGVVPPITASWAQKLQMENAAYDEAYVEAQNAGGGGAIRLFQWLDGTMADSTPDGTVVQESAGWGERSGDLTAFAGTASDVRLLFHLGSDAQNGYSGLAVDDVRITACCTPASCDDSLSCTDDVCDPDLGCIHPVSAMCDDADACTVDACEATNQCSHAPRNCDDGNGCTTDTCDPAQGCAHAPLDGVSCNDGSACTLEDTCVHGNCVGDPVDCLDTNACTVDLCNPASGQCSHPAVDCSDGDACTTDSCNPASGCAHVTNPGLCDDHDPCTTDSCDPASGCRHAFACDDANACTNDACDPASGACSHSALDCNDGVSCTEDTCSPSSGCAHTPHDSLCPPSTECALERCSPSVGCFVTYLVNTGCNGGNLCQSGRCDGTGYCSIRFVNSCGWPYTCGTCNPATGQCVYPDCDDHNSCTTDSCLPPFGPCRHEVSPACDDHDPCTADTCAADGSCAHGPADCSDSNACTIDSCSDGVCHHQDVSASCDDHDACTVDTCVGDTGCAHGPADCSDANPCTVDSCAGGACVHAAGTGSEITNLTVSKSFVSWNPASEQDSGTRYQVVRGSLAALPVGSVPASETCRLTNSTATAFQETAKPAQGAGYWYLVRAKHACGVGTYGYAERNGMPESERITHSCSP